MNRILLALSLILLPATLRAQDWGVLGGEGLPTGLFSEQAPRFNDPNKPYLAPDGSVRRHRDTSGLGYDGPTDFGMFTLRPDGRVCIDFGEGVDRCGVYVRDGEMRMLLSERQGRLPFRFELGLRD